MEEFLHNKFQRQNIDFWCGNFKFNTEMSLHIPKECATRNFKTITITKVGFVAHRVNIYFIGTTEKIVREQLLFSNKTCVASVARLRSPPIITFNTTCVASTSLRWHAPPVGGDVPSFLILTPLYLCISVMCASSRRRDEMWQLLIKTAEYSRSKSFIFK